MASSMSLVALQQLVEVSIYDVNEKSQLKRQQLLVQEFCHRKLPKVVLAARSSLGPSLEVIRANLLGCLTQLYPEQTCRRLPRPMSAARKKDILMRLAVKARIWQCVGFTKLRGRQC